MASAFPGFPPEMVTFFRGLKRNNRREWFQPRKHIYDEKVKAPMVELVDALNAAMAEFAPGYITDPQKAIYRIYRDTRFSPDKTPYKDHIAATFPRRGMTKHACAGFYFSVSHQECEVAGGVYMPGPEELRAIRTHLLERHEQFQAIVSAKGLRSLMGELYGDQLSRVPKGFPAEHPAASLVRYRQWLFYVVLDPAMVTTPKLYSEVLKRFRAMTPFTDFLNEPLMKARAAVPAKAFLE